MTTTTRLWMARLAAGLTQDQVIAQMLTLGRRLRVPLATPASLKTMLSNWENGRKAVIDPGYHRLFREIYGRTNEELGFPPEATDELTREIKDRLTVARNIDTQTITLFRTQLDIARQRDRRHGAITVLDQLRSQITELHDLLTFGLHRGHRQQLAIVLADACTLAGWEALDRGSPEQSWRHHEMAKVSAHEANSPAHLAYAIGQQAYILLDLGRTTDAVQQLEYARTVANDHTPSLLQCWLAAAHGEALAAAGAATEALTAFHAAHSCLPADPNDPGLPFLMLSETHLGRWRGHALTRLGNNTAVDELETALRNMPRDLGRSRLSLLVDLAYAHAATDHTAALTYAREARTLARTIGSERQRQRLGGLVLSARSG